MKKRGALIICLVAGMSMTVGALTHKAISANMKSQIIHYKGKKINQEVLEYNHTTYIPLRKLSELVGMPVDYKNGSIYLGETVNHSNVNNTDVLTHHGDKVQIGGTEAKYIALQHAGVAESNITVVKVKLDKEGKKFVYEVAFYADDKEYNYEIDAKTGDIVSYDYDIEGFEIPSINTNANYIGKEKAEQIALSHAQLAKNQVKYIQNELDEDDGIWEYEVKFRYGNQEHEYEINAYTGEIIDFSIDND